MTTTQTRTVEAVPTLNYRLACEGCHTRKIKCEPATPGAERGAGCCEACRINGRVCQFSPQGKRGRPKKSRSAKSSTSVPTTTTTSKPVAVASRTLSAAHIPTLLPSYAEHSGNGVFGHAQASARFNDNPFIQPNNGSVPILSMSPPRQLSQSPPKNSKVSPIQRKRASKDHPRLASISEAKSMPIDMPGQSSRSNSSTPGSDPATPDEMVNIVLDPLGHLSGSIGNTFIDDSFLNKASFMDDIEAVLEADPSLMHIEIESPNPKLYLQDSQSSPKSEHVTDFMRALKLCPQLPRYSETILSRPISLLASEDAEDVKALLARLDALCCKITEIIPISRRACLLDPPTCIVIFAAVMQAVDAVIDRLSLVQELDTRLDNSIRSYRQSALDPDAMVVDSANSYPETMNTEDLQRLNLDSCKYTGLDVENLLALTRVDFYLLQLSSIISQFDGYADKLATTTIMFHPANSTARLQAYHGTIESILGGWRSWCC